MRISNYDARRPRILVVEDDEDLRLFIKTVLVRAGFDVALAANGLEAIDRENPDFDVILLDLAMPQMDGFSFLAHRRGKLREIPVIVLTARHQSQDVKRAIELGAIDFLAKPFDNQMLLKRLQRAMKPIPRTGSSTVSW
ncbi:response regulator transcription factor [Asticcacaulis sp. AND118]|uniref:response regulator n=1 Tax=Asticcacaulis sp. AND118 TaxID=2840468 RepID=UPI001CFF9F6B|nr:response regulator transcription factor [Asticcacaulis sp. AND118]UDF04511.1 response regulator transcription factor [Asticcacaulis sp. AND118]